MAGNKRFNCENPPFRTEFACINNLINGDSYVCGNTGFEGERDAIDTATELCKVLNDLYFEKEVWIKLNNKLKKKLRKSQIDCNGVVSKSARLELENKRLKNLLKGMADKNSEIWLSDGRKIRLQKIFKGEMENDRE